MLLGDGDSRPNSLRFDIVSCTPLDKKDKVKGTGMESPVIFYRAVALSCCGEDKVIFLFLPLYFPSAVIILSPALQCRCPGSDPGSDQRGSRREGCPRC